LAIGDDNLEFVTYENRRAAIARDLGFTVVQPGVD